MEDFISLSSVNKSQAHLLGFYSSESMLCLIFNSKDTIILWKNK
jgi:hypothetical protein